MKPTRDDDAVVDLVDTILRDGAIVQADVVISVAEVPLVGVSLRAAIAGMTTMTEYGFLEEFDGRMRGIASPGTERRAIGVGGPEFDGELESGDAESDEATLSDGETGE